MASEIRVDKINSLSGVGTVTLSPTGVDISGITTVATFKVGTGVTASSDGDIFATGVTTSTTFVGNLTGNVTGNISGGTVAGSTGTFTGNVAVSGANITLQDSGGATDDRLTFGAGTDLSIYHDGSNSYISDTGDGGLFIQGSGGGAGITIEDPDGNDFIKCIDEGTGGAVELYKAGSKKLETISTGAKVKHTLQIEEESGTEYYQLVTNSYGGLEIQNETTKVAEFTDANTFELQDNLKFAVAGKGIDFSVTSDGSGTVTSEVLDEYEEGTFDVNYKTGGAGGNTVSSASYSSTGGLYTKIGDMVHFQIRINCTSSNALGGQIVIEGLPFTHVSTTIASGAYITISNTLGSSNNARLHIDGTEIRFQNLDGTNLGSTAGGINLNAQFHCAGTYRAA